MRFMRLRRRHPDPNTLASDGGAVLEGVPAPSAAELAAAARRTEAEHKAHIAQHLNDVDGVAHGDR